MWIKFLKLYYGKRVRIHIASLQSLNTDLHQATEVLSFAIKKLYDLRKKYDKWYAL